MALDGQLLRELEHPIHTLIKKQLGFSEPKLLEESLKSIQQGGDKDDLTRRLANLLDQRKAIKLSDKICELVDEFCLARDLPQINNTAVSKKRSLSNMVVEDDDDGQPSAPKMAKMMDGTDAPPPAAAVMSSSQIKAMMANAKKQLEERKAALAGIRSGNNPGAKVSLPPPRLVSVDTAPMMNKEDRAATIAALQARIQGSLEKNIGPVIPQQALNQANQKQGPQDMMSALVSDRPTALILDDKGRTVDASGQQINLTQHVPTLKANLRAKRNDEQRIEDGKTAKVQADEFKYFDGRVNLKGSQRPKRTTFNFVEPGTFQREGQRVRMKAQLEKLQASISTKARQTGITSATQLAKLVPKGDTKSATPDVEWWDALILKNGHSSQYDPSELREEAITNLVEHPIQLKPLESKAPEVVPVFLTKKEQKKLRRQNRREAWKEKQDKIRLGMLPPDEAKVKLSNMMRVLESDAIMDPSKTEAHVRAQMAKRLANHEKMNADRKLTPEERKQKMIRKIKEDTTAGVRVAVFRVKNLNNPSKKFKVETNAKQYFMTGTVVLYEDVNVVVVEGGPKQIKKYKQLMLNRIKWDEEVIKDKEGHEIMNNCVLVWEGETKERQFGDLKFKQAPSESFARDFFKNTGAEHYWDLAYSGAVLEYAEEVSM